MSANIVLADITVVARPIVSCIDNINIGTLSYQCLVSNFPIISKLEALEEEESKSYLMACPSIGAKIRYKCFLFGRDWLSRSR